ncbi:MAG: FMN-binding protein [Clostridia bacterium]|nr:FMN-binding protein [Clostridia bacterium]
MKKRILAALLAMSACAVIFSACSESDSYKDGTYEGKSEVYVTGEEEEEDAGSGYGVATITIKDNVIVACEFRTYEEDGTLKDDDYGKKGGEIANQDFFNKAQKAVKACPEYARLLVETNDVEQVDAISGATVNNTEFKEAVYDALNKARE